MSRGIQDDINTLTENLLSSPDKRRLLAPTLELALRDLGHAPDDAKNAVDRWVSQQVH